MGQGTRVEALELVAEVLRRKHLAIATMDLEALLGTVVELERAVRRVNQHLDSPLTPLEQRLAAQIGSLNHSCARLLAVSRQPLTELGALAREHGLAVALDRCA
jgi:hypothetical protein